MKVKLIQATQNPIDTMWVAARTCYSEKSPIEMWETRYPKNMRLLDSNIEKNKILNEHWDLVQKVLSSGHKSVAEHVYFTFAIEGISRACSHQLVRHRHCTFSQQSQRYVEIKESKDELQNLIIRPSSEKEQLKEIAEKYFVDVTDDNYMGYLYALREYLRAVKNGTKPEDARQILPNATKTNIVMSCNLSELMHICNLRLCTRAQDEIRDLFREIKRCVGDYDSKIATLLVPSCEVMGICTEHKCCGRKPHISKVSGNLELIYK